MSTSTIIALVLVAIMLAVAAVVMIVAYLKQVVHWQFLPAPADAKFPGIPEVQYVAPPDVSIPRLGEALNLALKALEVVYPVATLKTALTTLHIIVSQTNAWSDHTTLDRQVAGWADGNTIAVDHDLTALCHELAHVCDALMGEPDPEHLTWEARGIFAAINAYQSQLAQLKS